VLAMRPDVEDHQYTSIRYSERLADAGAIASIGSVGDSYVNALAESLIGLYKTECVRHELPWRNADELELATLNWVWWFNNTRLHSAIGWIPPIEFEINHHRHNPTSTPAGSRQLALHCTRALQILNILTIQYGDRIEAAH
jgi:putative transposase